MLVGHGCRLRFFMSGFFPNPWTHLTLSLKKISRYLNALAGVNRSYLGNSNPKNKQDQMKKIIRILYLLQIQNQPVLYCSLKIIFPPKHSFSRTDEGPDYLRLNFYRNGERSTNGLGYGMKIGLSIL